MCYKKELEVHYNNINEEFDLLSNVDLEDNAERTKIRENILEELKQSCVNIIDGINNPDNEDFKDAVLFLESLNYGYDICLVIELRNFIYKLMEV